jgi:hypothetical protein
LRDLALGDRGEVGLFRFVPRRSSRAFDFGQGFKNARLARLLRGCWDPKVCWSA